MYLATGGNAWNTVSDRNKKEHFKEIEARDVLERVAKMPLSTWSYKSEPGVKHMGPMAQDFHAAFGLGDSDKHISTVDADGVALAAIQGLHQENRELRAQLSTMESRLAQLEQRGGSSRTPAGLGWLGGIGAVAVAGGLVIAGRRRTSKGA